MIPSRSVLHQTITSMKKNVPRALRLVFRYTPGWTSANILLVIILGLLPLASLYVLKLLVDTVTMGITLDDKTMIADQLILILILAAAIALITACCRALSSYITEVQSVILTDRISDLIHSHSVSLDLTFYENAEYHDSLHRAQTDGPSRPGKIVNDLVQFGQSCISITVVGALILSFSPVAGIILIAAAIPATLLRFWYSQKTYALSLRQTEMERKSSYFHQLLTSNYPAKEIRLFNIGPFFRYQYSNLRNAIRHARLALSRSRAQWDIVSQGFITIAIFGSFAVIAFKTLEGVITLGDMVMYFAAFQLCIGYIQSIFSSMNALYEDQLFINNFFMFLDLKPAITVPANPVPVPSPIQNEVRIEGVTFTYPGSEKPVLSNVNLTLHPGEVIALVGENGAGKSTLLKLLTRLYAPDSGTISVDGISLEHTDPEEWRCHISALFQDFVRYQITANENISLADSSSLAGESAIKNAAHQSGADEVIGKLPEGYDTVLGHYFTGGQELSTGEWQKIALARAFFRDTDIVILDEPSSSLDALAEKEIFLKFREIIQNRSAILVSHRFSTIMMADHIYVLDNGTIAEDGTHAELMMKNGCYAEMFRAQADPYQNK
jgi:ATP-binding cassette, subfamily B, bacterial